MAVVICCFAPGKAAAVPNVMTYEGKLADSNGVPLTTPVNVTFTFRDAQVGGNLLGNGFSDMDTVTPNFSGMVSTEVGDDPGNPIPGAIFASDSVWLNVNVAGTDLPRTRITPVAAAVNAFPLFGPSFVTPQPAVTNAATNGTNLVVAYNRAKTLTPHGLARSATNRVCVFVPPGRYDFGTGQLVLDTEFVDLVGLSSSKADQYLAGASNGAGTGVVKQTANDVRIENILVACNRSSGALATDGTGPAAYFPNSSTTSTVMRNCEFRGTAFAYSMRVSTAYPGSFTDCLGERYSFGGTNGAASGTFLRCTGGGDAFGGNGGAASGNFTDCTGGDNSFGGGGTATGVFSNCTGGHFAFAGLSNTNYGTFTDCTGGDNSFGGNGGVAWGIFTRCKGGANAFGGNGGTAAGTFRSCTGGNTAFGGTSEGAAVGSFYRCVGGNNSFAGPRGNAADSRFLYCVGTTDSFTDQNSLLGTRAGTSPPVFLYCLLNGQPYP